MKQLTAETPSKCQKQHETVGRHTAGTQVAGGPGCHASVALDSYTNDAKQFSMKTPLLNALTYQISKIQCKQAA